MLTTSQLIAFALLDIAVILVVARLCGYAAKRVGQPSVVGEIIAGVLLGPSLLGLFAMADPPSFLACGPEVRGEAFVATLSSCLFPAQVLPVLNVLGQLALLLFMFLAGLQLDLGQLKGKGGKVAIVGIGVVVLPLGVGFALNPLLYGDLFAATDAAGAVIPSSTGFALFVGAMISITALPVMVRILQEKGLATSELGGVGIAAAALVTVLMFMAVAVAAGSAGGASTGELTLKMLLAIGYLAVMLLGVRPLMARVLGKAYADRAVALGVKEHAEPWESVDPSSPTGAGHVLSHAMFAWVFVMVLLSGLVAHLLGINVIVGGFMAGLVLPEREGLVRDMVTELFDVVVIVLLPIFLAFAGLGTDVTVLSAAVVPGMVVFILACIAAKWGGGMLLGRAAGLGWNEASLMGILMNCRGLLPLVVAIIGINEQVMSPAFQVVAVVMALVTTAMTGPAFDRVAARGRAVVDA